MTSDASPRDKDEQTHKLYLAKRWGDNAETNIEKWGNQPPEILLLALIEEVGEVADEIIKQTPEPHPDNTAETPFEGMELLHEMRELGFDVRDFLESEYPEPAGEGEHQKTSSHPIVGGEIQDSEAVQSEIDDLMPLGWQLSWALEGADCDV